jgi:UTP--glucose-1-phosphate uridylyltransferase
MLPLVDKPIIQYGVEEALDSGVENIIIVTGRGKSAIEDHFDVSFELENLLEARGKTRELELVRHVSDLIHVSYIRQKEALGLGHAVLVTKELVAEEPFAVVLADDVIVGGRPCLRQLLDVHEQVGASVLAVMEVPEEQISAYGAIAGEGEGRLYRVRDMVEKPAPDKAPSRLAIIGRYVLTPGIFGALTETPPGRLGEIQLTDGIRKLLESEPVYAYQFEGRRYDAGDKLGFLQATVELALRREGLGTAFREYLKGLTL